VILVGLDFGERRIGVAVSDPRGLAAQPLRVIERRSLAEDVSRVKEVVEARKAERIVVGLPLNMNGSIGPAARRARRFASRLARELGLEVIMQDERLSTVEAERALLAGNRSRAQRRELRDAVAAALILQSYLDVQRSADR
jgi:putative Holliday junction resolvase